VPEPQPERAAPEPEALPAPEFELASGPDTRASSSSLPSTPTPAASGWGSFLEGAADPAPSEPKMSSEEKRAKRLRERARAKREVVLMLTLQARESARMAGNAALGRRREAAGGDPSSAATPGRRDGRVRLEWSRELGKAGGGGSGGAAGAVAVGDSAACSAVPSGSYKKNWTGAGPTG
jgi:hypothetical protein